MSRGFGDVTLQIIAKANELWEGTYQPVGIVPTVRQVFYALATLQIVPKDDKGYAKVQTVLAMARNRGLYPFEGIYDGLRQLRTPLTWDGVGGFFDTVRDAYHFDRWSYQPRRVEVWLEKDAVASTVMSVVKEYQMPLLVDRGFLSVTAKKEASQRISKEARTIIYVGDHDPSGIDMLNGAKAWIESQIGEDISIERIAITDDDHADGSLPHLKVNTNDSRAGAYIERYGYSVVEVEALPPTILQARLRNAIEGCLDLAAWQVAINEENEHLDEIAELLEPMPSAEVP